MVVVVVAGGLGDLRLVVESLFTSGKHEVYVLTRKIKEQVTRVSPLSGKSYNALIETNYASEPELIHILDAHKAHTVISVVSLDFADVAEAQCRLIRAAAASNCVKRFIPSEFNIEYDADDKKLPYAEKKFHTVARRELEKTNLEFTYIYCGFFMDYFGMPHYPTNMRPLYIVVDAESGIAAVPGDGDAVISVAHTEDVARFIAASLNVEKWPRILTVVESRVTSNELVALTEKILGRSLSVHNDSLPDLLSHNIELLPSNKPSAVHFPEGEKQLMGLQADLGAAIALGCYDFSDLRDAVDLVALLERQEKPLLKLEDFMRVAWEGR